MASLTAKIWAESTVVAERYGDNFNDLVAFILFQLEECYPDGEGEIIESQTQNVIQRFRRSAIC